MSAFSLAGFGTVSATRSGKAQRYNDGATTTSSSPYPSVPAVSPRQAAPTDPQSVRDAAKYPAHLSTRETPND